MMELRRITLVNWHLFDVEDIEVQGNFGILGENRSGKSTILDMIQVVLSGASRSYLRLNAVAGEGSKARSASKRTVLSYCLGTLNDGDVRRPETLTYIALGFEDQEKQQPPITIGLAIEARQTDAAETILGRFVVIGKLLTTADFTDKRADGIYATQWDEVKARIIASVGDVNFVNHRDKAIDFVREYMRRLVPSLPNAEQSASALLKAVVNAMTLNQGYSATEFVRRFILEDNPINIRDLRSSIETYRSVSATIVTLREKLEALKELGGFIAAFEESLGQKDLENWLARRAWWLASRAENRAIKERIAEARRFIDAEKEDRGLAIEGIKDAEQEIERLRKAIATHEARSGRDQWLEVLKSVTADNDRLKKEVDRRRRSAIELVDLTQVLDDTGFMKAYCALVAGPDGKADRKAMRDAEQNFRTHVVVTVETVERRRRETAAQIVLLTKEITGIRQVLDEVDERGSAAYLSRETKLLLRRLESRGMDARPFCDLLEVADASWTAAAEALLGRDREAVFVERRNIREATALFREGRRDFQGASLVSLNKLDEFRDAPRQGTFPALFRSADPDARAFLQRRYGNVRLALTLEEFNQPGRAIMQDGLYDDGLVRSHRAVNPRDHKIGRAAQADHLINLREDFAQKADVLSGLQREEKLLTHALAALDLLKRQDTDRLADMLDSIDDCAERMRDAQERVAAIDAAGDDGLKERLRAQKAFQDRKKEELRTIDERSRKYQVDVEVGERALKSGEGTEGSAMNLSIAKARYGTQRRLYQYPEGSGAYRQRLEALRRRSHDSGTMGQSARNEAVAHRKLGQQAAEAADRAADRNRRAELDARRALHDYFNNPKFGVSSQVGPESELLADIKPWMDLLIEDIERNELRRYEDKAKEASERASVLFRGEFVNALNTRVSKMERDIEALNRSLRGHPFHNEIYSFHRTAEAQFQPILKIIDISRISDEALDTLFKPNVPDDFQHKDTIKAVEQLLEDPDKDVSAFEDYRNFYAFEIHMEDVHTKARTRWETRRNTGSGAEQQVPLYVAIGASLAAVYGSAVSHRGQKGMSPALFDEAFSKMDGKNQRAMMSFYADLGLQVVIAAPLEKKPAIIGYMHSLVEIDRINEQSFANVVYIGKRARDEILAMNPETLSDADIAARMAAE
ncbi:SbcC/MukB-like Walker B domain-containing protein [Neorhizobium galegae]|uniref:Blr1990 protein n=1 Tax=Neorhizobium galegae bv. orientalis str. HAMBI 540 TaxID=1028800 RepID=A0A068SY82_NEOGA|nr:SbcC/MukB-like Walker B domain-containing protein [Neorhizobium galegae]CDN50070.1 Blr1990 protein [Neorhizobium galegae bv. orientalis str. HAMBI 540]